MKIPTSRCSSPRFFQFQIMNWCAILFASECLSNSRTNGPGWELLSTSKETIASSSLRPQITINTPRIRHRRKLKPCLSLNVAEQMHSLVLESWFYWNIKNKSEIGMVQEKSSIVHILSGTLLAKHCSIKTLRDVTLIHKHYLQLSRCHTCVDSWDHRIINSQSWFSVKPRCFLFFLSHSQVHLAQHSCKRLSRLLSIHNRSHAEHRPPDRLQRLGEYRSRVDALDNELCRCRNLNLNGISTSALSFLANCEWWE